MSAIKATNKRKISKIKATVLCSENRTDNTADEKSVKPFLKWAGGKGQLLKEIERYYPFADGGITKNRLNLQDLLMICTEKVQRYF